MSEASSSVTAARRRATSRSCASVARALNSASVVHPARGGPSSTTISSRSSSAGWSASNATRSEPRRSVVAKSRRAPDVRKTWPAFLAAVSGVEGHQHRTNGVDGETGDHPCGAVGCPQGHPVATLDTARHEGARHGLDVFGDTPKREPGRPVDQGLVVPVQVGGPLQGLGDRPRLPIGRRAVGLCVVGHGCTSRPPPTTAGSRSWRRSVRARRARPRRCALRARGSVGHHRRPGRRSAPGCPVPTPAGRSHRSV